MTEVGTLLAMGGWAPPGSCYFRRQTRISVETGRRSFNENIGFASNDLPQVKTFLLPHAPAACCQRASVFDHRNNLSAVLIFHLLRPSVALTPSIARIADGRMR